MKKIPLLFLSLFLFGTLTGCGGGGMANQSNVSPSTSPASTTEAAPSTRSEELWFQNGEKKIYAKMYLPEEEQETYPAVIISHGFNGSYKDNEDRAEFFAQNGYAAVVFDFCGGGRTSKSDGEMTEMSVLTEAADLNAVIDGMLSFEYVEPENLFLLGASQGGYVSAYVAAQRAEDINALALLFPAFSLQDDCWERHGSIENIPETELVMNNTLGAIYSQDAMSIDIYEVIGGYKGDVLICHGTHDELVDISYSERAAEVYENAELKVIDKGGHGFQGKQLKESNAYLLDFLTSHTN